MRKQEKDASTIKIRSGQIQDFASISALELEAFPYQDSTYQDAAPSNPGSRPSARELYELAVRNRQESRVMHLLATGPKGRTLGFASGRPHETAVGKISEKFFILSQVAVGPEFQQRGIGAALVDRMRTSAKSFGFTHLLASIPDDLVSWYEGRGFDVLPTGTGLAWMEPAGPHDHLALPVDIPFELRGTVPAISGERPDPIEHGYTRLAMTSLGPGTACLTFPVAVGADPYDELFRIVNGDPATSAQLPHGAAVVMAILESQRKNTSGNSFMKACP